MPSYYPMVKNSAQRIVFPLLDADGDPVTGATSPDSEYSLDGASFADCTNEISEIATTSGVYYLDLLAAETNGDVVCIQVKSGNAKTTVLVFYTSAQSLDTVDTNVDAIKVQTDLLAFTSGNVHSHLKVEDDIDFGATKKASINTEVDTGLSDIDLDHLIQVTAGVEEPTDGSYLDQIMHKDVSQTYDPTTDSLEALRDRGDASWITATGFSTHAAADVWTVATRALTDKTGFSLSAAGIDDIIDDVIEGTLTLRQATRLFLSALAGKSTGGGTTTLTFRDNADSKARITATVDADGNRTAITLDGT